MRIVFLPLAAPIGLSSLVLLTVGESLCVLVVPMEPRTSPVSRRCVQSLQKGAVAPAGSQGHPDIHSLPTVSNMGPRVFVPRVYSLVGPSNNHLYSCPLTTAAFCAWHFAWRAQPVVPCALLHCLHHFCVEMMPWCLVVWCWRCQSTCRLSTTDSS